MSEHTTTLSTRERAHARRGAERTAAAMRTRDESVNADDTSPMPQTASGRLTSGTRGRKSVPPGETRRERFIRLGQYRARNAIQAIRLVGQLAAPTYEWTKEDSDKILGTLHEALAAIGLKFNSNPSVPKLEDTFTLKS